MLQEGEGHAADGEVVNGHSQQVARYLTMGSKGPQEGRERDWGVRSNISGCEAIGHGGDGCNYQFACYLTGGRGEG